MYSMTLVCHYIIDVLNQHPLSGNIIIVHCQIHRKELLVNLKQLMKYIFAYGTEKNLPIRDLGDRKYLYQLTQHSSWNRLFRPFLLCGCMRGQSGLEDHVCSMWTDTQYQSYMNKSKDQWENRSQLTEIRKRNRKCEYDIVTHRIWVDQKNMGRKNKSNRCIRTEKISRIT